VHAGGMARLTTLAVALVLVAACTSERSSDAGPDSIGDSTSSATTNTVPPILNTTTSPAPTIDPTSSTTQVCAPAGDFEAKGDDGPLALSAMVGNDIRTGADACYERIIIELSGPGDFPGWAVEYIDDPVQLGEGDEFVEIAGVNTLSVRMGMWMPTLEGAGYDGEIQIFPEGVDHILEMRKTYNHEGMCTWAIGLDDRYAFEASVLHNPERLVIDILINITGAG